MTNTVPPAKDFEVSVDEIDEGDVDTVVYPEEFYEVQGAIQSICELPPYPEKLLDECLAEEDDSVTPHPDVLERRKVIASLISTKFVDHEVTDMQVKMLARDPQPLLDVLEAQKVQIDRSIEREIASNKAAALKRAKTGIEEE